MKYERRLTAITYITVIAFSFLLIAFSMQVLSGIYQHVVADGQVGLYKLNFNNH